MKKTPSYYYVRYNIDEATIHRLAVKNKIKYDTRYSSVIAYHDDGTLDRECRRIMSNRKKNKKYRGNRIRRMINLAKHNPEYLGLLIHTANKWAKHYRDSQRILADMIYNGTHNIDISGLHYDILHSAKNAKEECYRIKEKAIQWSIKKGIAQDEGWQSFIDNNGMKMYAKAVSIGSFSFHWKLTEYEPKEEVKKIKCEFSEYSDKKLKNIYDVRLTLELLTRKN